MWPLAGSVFVLGGCLPSVALWLRDGASGAAAGLWQTAAAYAAVDSVFVATACILLAIAVQYGKTRNGTGHGVAPYPGAWLEADGHQALPQGFPPYLALAFIITVVTPSLVLAACLLSTAPTTQALASATLAPYLLVFLPQILLETRWLNRSFMTPMLPVLFAYYRFWQFIRSLGLVAGTQGAAGGQHSWLVYYLVALMCFWVFDTGCTIVWMPGMYEWQLQDAKLLAKLSKQHRQHREKAGSDAVGQNGSGTQGISSPARAAKLRHRWRLAGSGGLRDLDAYSFGT